MITIAFGLLSYLVVLALLAALCYDPMSVEIPDDLYPDEDDE